MDTDVLRVTVRCDQFAPQVVRQMISDLPEPEWIIGDAMLVASELVTNAVRHSSCTEQELLNVSISRDGQLRISVTDPGASGRTAQIAERAVESGGMGLKLVAELATRWGAQRTPVGYNVWAELELPG